MLGCKRRSVRIASHRQPQRVVPCARHPPPFLCAHSTSAGAIGLKTVDGRDACSLRPEKWLHPAPSCSPVKQLARDIAAPQAPSRNQAPAFFGNRCLAVWTRQSGKPLNVDGVSYGGQGQPAAGNLEAMDHAECSLCLIPFTHAAMSASATTASACRVMPRRFEPGTELCR